MKMIPLAILMGVAGVATQLYRRSVRRHGESTGWGGMPASGATSAGLAGQSDLPGAAGRWDEGARLQDDEAPGLQARTGSMGAAQPDDLFASSSQRGEEPVAAGLPDLTRGA
jgi:hypothetical protein